MLKVPPLMLQLDGPVRHHARRVVRSHQNKTDTMKTNFITQIMILNERYLIIDKVHEQL